LPSQSDVPPGELLAVLRDAAELLDPIGLIAGAMFFVKDAAYRYVAMSPATRAAIGLGDHESPLGRTDFDLFPPVIAESFRRNDRQVIEHGRTLLDEVHLVGTRGGVTMLTYSSKWPLHDRAGRVVGLVGINRPHESAMTTEHGDEIGRLMPAVRHVLNHYARRLGTAELARECGLSTSHFMRLFRRQMGMTAHAFLERVRISQASSLLRTGGLPIARVARSCGFYDHSSFVKRFRRHTGLTPLAYRKANRPRLTAGLFTAAREGDPAPVEKASCGATDRER
jgi:AraC-like DNA-binding protein